MNSGQEAAAAGGEERTKEQKGNQLLSACARGDKVEMHRLIREEGDDILKYQRKEGGMRPLIIAAKKGQKEVVDSLLNQYRKKIDLDATCHGHCTALVGMSCISFIWYLPIHLSTCDIRSGQLTMDIVKLYMHYVVKVQP